MTTTKRFQDVLVDYHPVDPDHFAGNAEVGVLVDLELDQGRSIRVYRVRFQPGSRTNWHRHTGVQLLFVEEGHGRIQREGGQVEEIGKGDAVFVAPGEKHWHGATGETAMTHVAVNLDAETLWLERVSEDLS